MEKNIRLINELLELDFEPIKEGELGKEIKKQTKEKGRSGDSSIDELKNNLYKELKESFDQHKQNILLRFKKTIKYEFSKQENKNLLDNIKSKLGSSNSGIKLLQEGLNKILKSNIAEDGKIGPESIGAIWKFQKSNGLDADGISGNKTLNKIDQLLTSTERNTSATNNGNGTMPSNQDNTGTINIQGDNTYDSLSDMLSNSKIDQPISINDKGEWIKNMKGNSTTEYQYIRPDNLKEPLPQEGTYTIDVNTNTVSYQNDPKGKVEFKIIKQKLQGNITKEPNIENNTDNKTGGITADNSNKQIESSEKSKTLREVYKTFVSEISGDMPLVISADGKSLNMNLDNNGKPYYKRGNNMLIPNNNSLPAYGLYKIDETKKIITWSGKEGDELKFEKIGE